MSRRADYEVTLQDQRIEVVLSPAQDKAQVDNTSWELVHLGPGEYLARHEGTQYHLWVDLESGQICLNGHTRALQVDSARDLALAKALSGSAAASGTGIVKSPMPGRVVAMLVQEGDTVKASQPVAIVEAMKMENELHAPVDGVVTAVRVSAQDAVDAGQVLCEIAPPPS